MFPKPDASVDTIKHTMTSDSDTITLNYPAGRNAASYGTDGNHRVTGTDFSELVAQLGHLTVTFGASNVTVVNNTDRTFKNGTTVHVHLDVAGYDIDDDQAVDGVTELALVEIALGSPDASDSNGAVESQACTAASGLATGINGALASDDVATFDVPRNVVAAWTGTAVLTVTGTDVNGKTIVESSASGTSLTGKKAFKTVTGVTTSADITALTVGTSKVLGLPVFLTSAADVLAEKEDDAAATAGTIVVGDTTTATATTGDVRGTYAPNSNPDGSKEFTLTALVRSSSYLGVDQYAG